jgi:hypothetical protein
MYPTGDCGTALFSSMSRSQQLSLVFIEKLLLHWLIRTTLSILGYPVLVPSHHDNSEIPDAMITAVNLTQDVRNSLITKHTLFCQL